MWVSDAETQPVVGDISPLFVGIWCRHTCHSRASDMCERVCASLCGVRLGGAWSWWWVRGATTCISNYLFWHVPFVNVSFAAFAFYSPSTLQNLINLHTVSFLLPGTASRLPNVFSNNSIDLWKCNILSQFETNKCNIEGHQLVIHQTFQRKPWTPWFFMIFFYRMSTYRSIQ